MKQMSKDAELSATYTNHCLRATTSTVLVNAGVENRNICSVTGHRNEASIKSYVQEPSLQQRAEMSDIIHSYGKEENMPIVKKLNPTTTSTITSNALAVKNTNAGVNIDTATAVFAGANFSGATNINVIINK